MQATLEKIEKLTESVSTFWLRPKQHLGYTAGQFVEVSLPHDNPDDRGTKRWFTLSSSPTEELISITTKFSTPSSTFKTRLQDLKPGDSLEVSEAMGDFVLPKDTSIPLVFIVGGIGITPLRSMIKSLADSGEKRDIKVIIGLQKAEDAVFIKLLYEYGIVPHVILSDPGTEWAGETGKISGAMIKRLVKDLSDKTFYISGPEKMVENLNAQLLQQGAQKDQLVGDYFPGY